ncbi:MAG: DUF3068 domain-containing protein [Nocardiopsaceae bacterium]|nr:DUF3068 domain-containing protein [Nocardiopsaceae bacterium]
MAHPEEQPLPPLARVAHRARVALRRTPAALRHDLGDLRRARTLRCVLAGIGAFLIATGLMLRFYAAPLLILDVPGYYGKQVLTDPHATYFNQAKLTMVRNAPLSYVNTIRGDSSAATGSTDTWDSYAYLWDPKTGERLENTYQRAVFNRHTGQLLDCCGASVNDDPNVRQYGQGNLFPLGTQKTTYQVYDVNTERAWPARFSGTAVVDGILTYKFTQHIPATQVQKVPNIPMSLLGIPGASYTVTANRTYQATSTFWVDPRTGIPIDVEEKVTSQLHDPSDIGSLTVVSADLKMTPSNQASLAAYSGDRASQITLLRLIGPLVALVLGVLLLLAAVFWPRLRPGWPRLRPGRAPGSGVSGSAPSPR